jgi:Asp/Glu/hydantoin racemase
LFDEAKSGQTEIMKIKKQEGHQATIIVGYFDPLISFLRELLSQATI